MRPTCLPFLLRFPDDAIQSNACRFQSLPPVRPMVPQLAVLVLVRIVAPSRRLCLVLGPWWCLRSGWDRMSVANIPNVVDVDPGAVRCNKMEMKTMLQLFACGRKTKWAVTVTTTMSWHRLPHPRMKKRWIRKTCHSSSPNKNFLRRNKPGGIGNCVMETRLRSNRWWLAIVGRPTEPHRGKVGKRIVPELFFGFVQFASSNT